MSRTYRITSGRELVWAPHWPGEDATIAFDATSGDYWVLGQDAARLVREVASLPMIGSSCASEDFTARDPETLATLEHLWRAGLLSAWDNGIPVPLASSRADVD